MDIFIKFTAEEILQMLEEKVTMEGYVVKRATLDATPVRPSEHERPDKNALRGVMLQIEKYVEPPAEPEEPIGDGGEEPETPVDPETGEGDETPTEPVENPEEPAENTEETN